jgi:ATP-dependent Zn protease
MPADWISLLVSWLPFIFLILVWVLVSVFLSQRAGGAHLERVNKFYEVQVKEMQRTNALLDRIAVALEKRAGTSA